MNSPIRTTLHVETSVPAPNTSPNNANPNTPGLGPQTATPGTPAHTSPSPPQEEREGPSAAALAQAEERRNTNPHSLPAPTQSGATPLPILDFISSDETIDRYSEIITASGWKLDSYLRNPVFQNAHNYGDIIFTLGKALLTEIRTGPSSLNSQPSTYLYQRIQFATDVNPVARIAYGLYHGKFLNAVSVGFIPLRWQDAPSPSSSSSSSSIPNLETTPRRRYLQQELLEVSAVSIPANPNALALAYKAGALAKSDLHEIADLCRRTISLPLHQISTLNPHLLRLASQFATILKQLTR